MRCNANEVSYMEVLVQDQLSLFCEERIEKSTVPQGLYMYQVRHADEDWSKPAEIKNFILVNFFGTLITKKPLLTEEETFLCIESEADWEEIAMRDEIGLGSFAN